MKIYSLLLLLALLPSCKKYLDAKPDKSLVLPVTLADLQSVLDADFLMNSSFPNAGAVAGSDFYLTSADWESLYDPSEKADYIWDAGAANDNDWLYGYTRINRANVVLDRIDNITVDASSENMQADIKGQALFFRAISLNSLAQVFAPVYDPGTAATAVGLPLKTTSDINEPTVRSTVEQTYDAVITDLQRATSLLPVTPLFKTRPSKPAVYALLSRIYLQMSNYAKALLYADSCLALFDNLVNFNTLDSTAFASFQAFSDEVIFHCRLTGGSSLDPSYCRIDTALYNAYEQNDLRKAIYFSTNSDGSHSFKADYTGNNFGQPFYGFASDEIYLIKAECEARSNNVTAAMQALNALLQTRWRTGTFVPFTAGNADEALSLVLEERRKELVMRGDIRWTDLRRLNREGRTTTLKRIVNGTGYTLEPGDLRYVFLIPQEVIGLSGIEQNGR